MRELTEEELGILELLRDAFLAFAGLEQAHPADAEEFAAALHAMQNIILARPATEVVYGHWKEEDGA